MTVHVHNYDYIIMSHSMRKPTTWVSTHGTQFDSNLPAQSQKNTRSLVFRMHEEGSMERKQEALTNCTADLRLCFRICRLLVFWCGGSIMIIYFFETVLKINVNLKILIRFMFQSTILVMSRSRYGFLRNCC